MKPIRALLNKIAAPAKPTTAAWKITRGVPLRSAAAKDGPSPGTPTTFQKCLAVHLHFAAARGALSS